MDNIEKSKRKFSDSFCVDIDLREYKVTGDSSPLFDPEMELSSHDAMS